jgi:glyoxylase-like metal-dependent hydrolase (beta-lactamase superfamily II)
VVLDNAKKEQHMVSRASIEISRRQLLAAGGLTVAAACLAPRTLFAQLDGLVENAFKEAATAKVTVQTLRRNVSVLLGPGGNIAVLTGPDGKLLVDAEIITSRPNVSAALASINSDPIKQLINTHWHFDHTGGNEWLHEAGASILAQENTRKHLSVDTRVEGWVHTFPAAPAGAIPSTVFKEDHTLHANGTTLILKHYLPAHTDSDISVHFAEADIFHTGDTFWNRDYPFIDYSTGGSIDGTIRAAEANIAKVTGKMIVIPGHGAVGGKADLILFRDVMVETRDKVSPWPKLSRRSPPPGMTRNGATCSFPRVHLLDLCTRAFSAFLAARNLTPREPFCQKGPAGHEVSFRQHRTSPRSDVAREASNYRDLQGSGQGPRRLAQARFGRRPSGGPHRPRRRK